MGGFYLQYELTGICKLISCYFELALELWWRSPFSWKRDIWGEVNLLLDTNFNGERMYRERCRYTNIRGYDEAIYVRCNYGERHHGNGSRALIHTIESARKSCTNIQNLYFWPFTEAGLMLIERVRHLTGFSIENSLK